jgi:prokaryotic ubiquitin-like protein Pup
MYVRFGVIAPSGRVKAEQRREKENPMAEREQIRKPATKRETDDVQETTAASKQGEKIKAELDDLLDEIDEVLETNAEEFVKSYVQKGGE